VSDVPERDDYDEPLGICQRGPDGIETVATGHAGFADAFAHFDRAVEIHAVILPDVDGDGEDGDKNGDGSVNGGGDEDGSGDDLREMPSTPAR
jgi:hypothetical protein